MIGNSGLIIYIRYYWSSTQGEYLRQEYQIFFYIKIIIEGLFAVKLMKKVERFSIL